MTEKNTTDNIPEFLKKKCTIMAVGYWQIVYVIIGIWLWLNGIGDGGYGFPVYSMLFIAFSAYVYKEALYGNILEGNKKIVYYLAFVFAMLSPVFWLVWALMWTNSKED
ncbi:hypothetical protein ACFLQI_01665 [Candidatus Undinarchaeota archaeon]